MELDINSVAPREVSVRERSAAQRSGSQEPPQPQQNRAAELMMQQKIEEQRQKSLASAKNVDAAKYFKEILRFTEIFNKKLKFNIDQNSEQVIVKVVDTETDKVIKEIPPEELQRLYSSMKEAIGLLIDEQR
jgi:flagellar protein FlaG